MTPKDQYILRLNKLGYSEKEINFIINDAWECYNIIKPNGISYKSYMDKWTESKQPIVIFPISKDRLSIIMIDITSFSVQPLTLYKKN